MANPVDLVVVGLGYVGLPLAREAIRAGFTVTGFDANAAIVQSLQEGRSHVDDITDADVQDMLQRGFRASGSEAVLSSAQTVVICVPTPLRKDGDPDLSAVESAAHAVARNARHGQLIVLESTTYPGTTEELLVPILNTSGLTSGVDLHVAFSPERIDPGNAKFGLRNTPKVVGGLTVACTERAREFYRQIVDEVVVAKGPKEAELTKLLENTYRHINIAFVNEMLRFGHELDIDVWDAIRCAATKPFGFQAFYPGPGVGGHCIPIDPSYLSHRVMSHLGQPFRFVELAQEINQGMPGYVARRAQDLLNDVGKPVKGASVVLLGVTYKADIADQRESPAIKVAEALITLGANLSYVDPFVPNWIVQDAAIRRHEHLAEALQEVDLGILLQMHRAFDPTTMTEQSTPILDTRGLLTGEAISRL